MVAESRINEKKTESEQDAQREMDNMKDYAREILEIAGLGKDENLKKKVADRGRVIEGYKTKLKINKDIDKKIIFSIDIGFKWGPPTRVSEEIHKDNRAKTVYADIDKKICDAFGDLANGKKEKLIDEVEEKFNLSIFFSTPRLVDNFSFEKEEYEDTEDDRRKLEEEMKELREWQKNTDEKKEEIEQYIDQRENELQEEIEKSEEYKRYQKAKETAREKLEYKVPQERKEFEGKIKKEKEIREVKKRILEIEDRDARCTRADENTLDPRQTDDSQKIHVIRINDGDGGYNKRYTKGIFEVLDANKEKDILVLRTGVVSFYNNQVRGKKQRTFIAGKDDGHAFVQQIPNTTESVEAALEYLKPAEIKKAEEEGREIRRQGDIFFKEMKRSSNMDALEGTDHEAKETEDGWIIDHEEHGSLELKGKWKAVRNKSASRPSQRGRRRNVRD